MTCHNRILWCPLAIVAALLVVSSAEAEIPFEYEGAGASLSFVVADSIGAGIGLGGHALLRMDLEPYGDFDLYPNLAMWYGVDDEGTGTLREESLFEVALDLDVRYCLPLPEYVTVRPFLGAGVAPMIYRHKRDPGKTVTKPSGAVNVFAGTDIPVGPTQKGFLEVRGKFFGKFHALKLTFGILFTPPEKTKE